MTDEGGISPSPLAFRASPIPNAIESADNDLRSKVKEVHQPPIALNGIIEKPGDNDYFKFAGKKGQVWEIECFGRRLRTGIDPIINIIDPAGKYIAGNDDSRGPDCYVRFTVPADGEYTIRVRDHLKRGQPDFVYRVELNPPKPKLILGIPRTTRYGQERQALVIPRGNRFATLVSATRQNFGGSIALDPKNLPAGIKMVSQPMAANLNTMPVVFEASEDAPLGGALIEFTGQHADPNQKISGKFYNLADFVLGPPNNSRYVGSYVDKLPVAVVDKVPFRLEIVQPKAPLVRNGSTRIKVVAHREAGFDAPISVQFPFRPPGVGTTGAITIPKGKSEAYYPLNANANAQLGKWPVYVIGQSDVKGPAWVSSQMATLEVAEPYVTLTIKRGSVEQGQATQLIGTINQLKPFEGEAKAQLLGLPHEVTAPIKSFTKDTKELIFDLHTTAKSPAGNHKTVFCRVTVTHQNEPVVSTAGNTQVLISKPVVKKQAVAAKPKPQPAKTQSVAAKPKPLSRLEKLRLESKKNRNKSSEPKS